MLLSLTGDLCRVICDVEVSIDCFRLEISYKQKLG